ncbi:uncharacterized protein [Struthio camelus]|uniref:uncharacterized protein isoform X1 n=1 Tax=Struthio camelus TaxID=8801 RepID=UPI003603B446
MECEVHLWMDLAVRTAPQQNQEEMWPQKEDEDRSSELLLSSRVKVTRHHRTKDRHLLLFPDAIAIASFKCGSTFLLKHRVPLSELWVLCSKDEVAGGGRKGEEEVFGLKCSNTLILAWPTNLRVVTFSSQELKELWISTILRQSPGAQVTRLMSLRVLVKVVGCCGPPYYVKSQRQREAVGRAPAGARAQRQMRMPMQPQMPEPGEGREHAEGQTELQAEEPLERLVLVHVAGQEGALLDRPCSPLSAKTKAGRDVATQVGPGELQVFDFDAEVQPLLQELLDQVVEKAFLELRVEEEEELAKLQLPELAEGELPYADYAKPQCLEEWEKQPQEEKGQSRDEGEASALGPAGPTAGPAPDVPVQREGEGDTPSEGPERTETAVVAVPGTPEGEEAAPASESPGQAGTKGVPGEAFPQADRGEPGLRAVKSTKAPAAELPTQQERQASALTPETTGSEAAAAAGQSGSEGACVQIPAEGSGPILEPKSTDRTTREALPQSHETEGGQLQDAPLKTEALSPSESTEGSNMEEATLNMGSACPGSAFPAAEGSEAPEVSVPAPPAALGEPVTTETVTLTDTAARRGQTAPEEDDPMDSDWAHVPVCWVL